MKKNIILLENIRSAYNVWNIMRTADALWRDVWLSGYTPHPAEQPKVIKTSLWAEETVGIERFDSTQDAIEKARELGLVILAWEITDGAIDLDKLEWQKTKKMLVLWNEVDGVLNSTLELVDYVVYIPMNWVKESMNVGQSAAIFMWELWK